MIGACLLLALSGPMPQACVQPPPAVVVVDRTPDRPYGWLAPEPWRSLAVCESGMGGVPRWSYNGDSGFDGGLQFHPDTWTWLKPDGYPDFAWQATPRQQIAVAEITHDLQGWQAWPVCSRKIGLRP